MIGMMITSWTNKISEITPLSVVRAFENSPNDDAIAALVGQYTLLCS
jgi:hypothetical protein